MKKKILIIIFLINFNIIRTTLKNNQQSIIPININICGIFENREYENININNQLYFNVHKAPEITELSTYNPTLNITSLTLVKSRVNSDPYITNIKAQKKNELIREQEKKLRKQNKNYKNKDWRDIDITFSNGEIKSFVISSKYKIMMTDKTLKIQNTLDFSQLKGEGLTLNQWKEK